MEKLANLRVCASCEWIFSLPAPDGCPKCHFGHYGAHRVYGSRAYRYARSQKPWLDKKMGDFYIGLLHEIERTNHKKGGGQWPRKYQQK